LTARSVSPLVLFARLMAKVRLRHLQLLVAVEEMRSLQKAADSVGLSQPAATHALAEIESLFDGPLFDRHARGMRATPLGQLVVPLARTVLHSMQACAEAIATRRQGAEALVRVGANSAAISALLCPQLPAFSADHPEVVIDVVEIGNDGLRALTDERALDIVITRTAEKLPSGFQSVPSIEDHYVVACSPGHPLASKSSVTSSDLERCTWLMPPATGIGSRDFHVQLDTLGISPPICWVGGRNMLVTLAMVEARGLVVFVPYNAISQLVERGLLTVLNGPVHVSLAPLAAVFNVERARVEPAINLLIRHMSRSSVASS
jgi:DNA-binding transcriptional LysR family regulator